MYKEEVQTIVSDRHLTAREAVPINRVAAWPQALAMTRINGGVIMVLAIAAAAVSYWWVSNYLITLGFAVNEARERVESVRAVNRDLELAAMNQESYGSVEERIRHLEMVRVDAIEYLAAAKDNVARR